MDVQALDPYYCHDNGRPGIDPVVLIKMMLIQHPFGILTLRESHRRIDDTVFYRWFLGYSLLDKIPQFSTVSYAFCKRFSEEEEKTVSTTDPDCGMFVKGEHEQQFAYKAHTICGNKGFVLEVRCAGMLTVLERDSAPK